MPQSLRRQLAVICFVLLPVVYAAIGAGAYRTYGEHLRLLAVETSTTATTVMVSINRNLAAAAAVAATSSRHPGMRALDPAAATEVLLPQVGGPNGLLNNAVTANRQGQAQAWAWPPDPAVEGRIDAAWLAKVAATGQPQVSGMLGGPGEPTQSIMHGYPILSTDNQRGGVLALAVHLEPLEQMLKAILRPDESVVTLTVQDSVVVARSRDLARYVGRPIQARGDEQVPADVPSTVIRPGVDGVERGPWLVSVGIPTSVAAERSAPIFRCNLAISIASTILVFGVTFIFGRRWLKAFDHLDDAAKRVSRGDLSPLEPRPLPTAEMARLQQTVSGLITNLQSAHELLDARVDDERRIREELQSLQQQVIRQERLAAIGVLVSGVAHELNNPLQAILGFADLLQMQQDMPESARADLTLIQKESVRAGAIIRNLLRFGRQVSEPTPVKFRDVITSVMELRQRKLEELNIRVEVDEKSVAPVMAIFAELQQVLLNFAINAEQAIVHSGTGQRQVVIRSGDRDGWAWLEAEDSGPGVPPEHEAKLFQPFYTTKVVGQGTGLGLSVSYDIIRSHGGRIGYRRSASGGAVFFFELPIVPDEPS